ncbi:hypothetical protein ACFSJY_02915 [Thalassotalea euphylliae]|uniref:hypothetical protein n=1 Tax=Thalassotalea euphylliae TaxID=1655234 RepID=UPI003644C9B6
MPIKVVWNKGIFNCRFTGFIEHGDVFSAMKSFYHDEQASHADAIIIDLSAVDTMVSNFQLMNHVTTIDEKNAHVFENMKFAFIKGNASAQAFIDKYLALAKKIPWHYHVADSLEDAECWVAL